MQSPNMLTLRSPSTTAWGFLVPFGRTHSITKDIVELSRIKPKYALGRGNESDIVVKHPAISGVHCILRQTLGRDGTIGAILEDYSRHGTFVNGVRVPNDNVAISNNDLISLSFDKDGPVAFRFRTSVAGVLEMSYELGPLIGSGSFATVHSAVEQDSGNKVALKIIRRDYHSFSDEGVLDISKEVNIMKRLQHPNVIELRGAFDGGIHTYIIMELFPLGSLFALIQRAALDEDDAKSVAKDVCRALDYLHSQNVVHRDIKPHNILVACAEPLFVKVADFGLAKDFSVKELRTICGTPLYMAPEIYGRNLSAYTVKVDMWGLGITMFKVLSPQSPWDDRDIEWKEGIPRAKMIRWARLRVQYSKAARNFISQLLQHIPERWPDAAQMLQHAWIQTE